jgi:hypothetical protein
MLMNEAPFPVSAWASRATKGRFPSAIPMGFSLPD